jgi:multidrug efflux pump
MVRQLEGSVLTAIALVMIVVLAALGTRSAMLVGFAIPTSFLLCFILLGVMGIPISNIVMFGLILAVGMLVDGAIVVVEYADKRLSEGARPMQAYTDAAKRMFWPIVSSTATTLCAFLPMLFWPGVPGRVHGHAAGDADLRSVGLADRGADLPAGPGRRRGALVAQYRPRRPC